MTKELEENLRKARKLIEAFADSPLEEAQDSVAVARALLALAQQAGRECTCHPDDNPPRPCPQKFALSECRAAAGLVSMKIKP